MRKNKKGQIDQIGMMVAPLVGIAIVLVIGFLIFAEVKEQAVGMANVTVENNRSITLSLNTRVSLGHDWVTGIVIYSEWNSSFAINTSLGAGNYTLYNLNTDDTAFINLTNNATSCAGCDAKEAFVTVSYAQPSYAMNGTDQVVGAIEDIPGWLPIIVITVIGALLIGLVSFFRNRA